MKRKSRACATVGKEFLENTSMHGLKYIAEKERHYFERAMWVFIFISGVVFSTYLGWIVWKKFDDAPVLTSIETTDHPLSQVNFPAVTICNQNRISKIKIDRLLKNPRYQDVDDDDLKFALRIMTKLDSAFNRTSEILRIANIFQKLKLDVNELINMTLQVIVSCDDFILQCQWLNIPTPCGELFSLRPTDDGLCCTFNSMQPNWTVGTSRSSQFTKQGDIKRVTIAGIKTGLSVALDANLEDYAATTGRFNGFKVLLHEAHDFPEVSERGFLVGPGVEANAGVGPVSGYITRAVQQLSIEKRKCRLDSENNLAFYQNYSISSCFMECLTIQMINSCDCYPYFHPASTLHRTCDLSDYTCLNNAFNAYRDNRDTSCSCVPSCNDLWFLVELSYAQFPGETFVESRMASRILAKKPDVPASNLKDYLRKNVALLNVYYKEQTGNLYCSDVRFGIEDFISAMGGLLGLGFGFSFISAIEIIYFFGIRWYFTRNIEEKRRRERSTRSWKAGSSDNRLFIISHKIPVK